MNRKGGGINISFGTILMVVCFVLVFFNYKTFSGIIINNESLQKQAENHSPNPSVQTQQLDSKQLIQKDIAENFVTVSVKGDDVKRGNLILVNSTHPYDFDANSSVVPMPEIITLPDAKDAEYWVKSNYDTLTVEAHSMLDRMLCDFAVESGNTDIMVYDTYRTYEDQKNVQYSKILELGEQEGRRLATNPGESEHHTNLALDLTLFDGSAYREYDGTGIYSLISENCYKYGFILRYPEEKTDITGITYEPWHLRYVGIPHAYYITKNGICLEEYIELLKKYPIDSYRLEITTDNAETYVVYYCDASEELSEIKIPKNGTYTLSGTNDGGIVVTYRK